MRENAEAKAWRYLGEGRVVITKVNETTVQAIVRGDGRGHHVLINARNEACTCPARTTQCSHLRAVRRVTAIQPEESNAH